MSECPNCGGDGYTAEHDPTDLSYEHVELGHCTFCPVQVQCDLCEGTGQIHKPHSEAQN